MNKPMLVLAALFGLALTSAAPAHEYAAQGIAIAHPWSRPTPPSAPVASGFLTLTNTTDAPDRLLSVSSPIAARAEIHRSAVDEDGVARMRPVDGGVALAPGATVDFAAERLHVMFIAPNRTLTDKSQFPATLVFERAGPVNVEFMVQRRPGEPSASSHSGHGG